MSDGPLWLDAFPRTWEAAHERSVRGRTGNVVYYPGARRDGGSDGVWLRVLPAGGEPWTGVFSSDNRPGRLNVVASWPDPEQVFVAAGGAPYLVRADDPDAWSRIDRPSVRRFEPVGGLALLLDDDVLSAYDREGLAWESDALGPAVHWLGIHLRHGRTISEPASW